MPSKQSAPNTKSKPVLVVVINEFGIGGIQNLYARVLPLLTSRYTVHLVGYKAKGHYFDMLPEQGVTTHFLPSHGRFDYRTLRDFARFFTSCKADIVHANGHSSNIFCTLAAAFARVPVRIAHIHTNASHWYSSHAIARLKQNLEESLVLRFFVNRVITISQTLYDKYTRCMWLPSRLFTVVHNGVPFPADLPPLTGPTLREQFGLACDERLLGFVGRLVPGKGLDYLMQVAHQLEQAHIRFRLFIIGDGDLQIRKQAMQSAAAMRDPTRVVFAGEQRDVSKYYQQLDALLFTSEPGAEGLATVVLEAASHGLPIVARSGGPEREVAPYYARLTFFEDHASPAAALQAALALPPDSSNRIDHFSVEAMAQRLDTLYTALLARKRITHD